MTHISIKPPKKKQDLIYGKSFPRKLRHCVIGLCQCGFHGTHMCHDCVMTNSLANQYIHSEVLKRWPTSVIGPYHRMTLVFEKESLPSGLFGPVRLLGV